MDARPQDRNCFSPVTVIDCFTNVPTSGRQDGWKKDHRAEGVNTHHRGYGVTHLYPWFAHGFDMYDGRDIPQPMWGEYVGYKLGSLPVSEETILNRIIGMPTYIDETPGYSDQVIAALKKIANNFAAAK